MNLIQQSVQQITRENLKNYYDTEQAEDELMDMLQSNRLFKMKDTTLDFIKKITGQSGNSFTIRETGKFLSDFINELKKYNLKSRSNQCGQYNQIKLNNIRKELITQLTNIRLIDLKSSLIKI